MIMHVLRIALITMHWILVSNQRALIFNNYHFSHFNLHNNWQSVISQFQSSQPSSSGEPVTQLIISGVLVCKQAIQLFFNLDDIAANLVKVTFHDVAFNQEILRIFIRSKTVIYLNQLNFDSCNLQNKDLQIFSQVNLPNLTKLSLANNYIGKQGFKHLSKAKLPNLQALNLQWCSLIQQKSVDYLLQLNLTNLKQLNIAETAISGQNIFRLIQRIGSQNLVSFSIAGNNIDAQFFSNFSKLHFQNLQKLSISNLLLDEDVSTYLQNLKFPKLAYLDIGQNWLFVDDNYKFLNKLNYPNLTCLRITNTAFDSGFFSHLALQFQSTNFQYLYIDGTGISKEQFKYFITLNFSQTKTLVLRRASVTPELANQFILKNQFLGLQRLDLTIMSGSGDIFDSIISKQWPNLKILELSRIGAVNITKLNSINNATFPKLESIKMKVRNLDYTQILSLISFFTRTCQKLNSIQLLVFDHLKLMQKLQQIQNINISRAVSIKIIKYLSDLQFVVEEIHLITLYLQPNQKPIVYSLDFLQSVVEQYQVYSAEKEIFPNQQLTVSMAKIYAQKLNFISLQTLSDFQNATMLQLIVEQFRQKQQKCVMPSLGALKIRNMTEKGFSTFCLCQFPNLSILDIQFGENITTNGTNFKIFHKNYSQLRALSLKGPTLSGNQITEMFQQQQFCSLENISLFGSRLTSEDFRKILGGNQNIRRIRNIELQSLSLGRDLSFFSDFQIVAKTFNISKQIIGQSFNQLSLLNYQFVEIIKIISAGINNQKFIQFFEQLKQRGVNSLPKLKVLILPENYIQSSGTKQLFQFGVPQLEFLTLAYNKDPIILNTVLSSSTSHRLKKFQIYKNEEDSIDPNLDIKNGRYFQILVIQSAKMHASDLKILSKLDFRSLIYIVLIISSTFECQSFDYLLKISERVNVMIIFFMDSAKVETNCANSNQTKSSPNINLKNIKKITIRCYEHIQTNVRYFLDMFSFEGQIQYLQLKGTYPSKETLNRISQTANLDYLAILQLDFNDLTDEPVSRILNRDFKQLQILSLSNNAALTSQSIKPMENRTYNYVKYLDFGFTMIGDEAVRILSTCKLPWLHSLVLTNTQITSRSLQYISKLNSPNLNQLDLSSNNLGYEDLLKLSTTYQHFPYLKKIYLYPTLMASELQKLSKFWNKGRPKEKQIEIQTNVVNMSDNQQQSIF